VFWVILVYFNIRNTLNNSWDPLHIHTVCAGVNVPDFGRMILELKYTDITKNTYIRN